MLGNFLVEQDVKSYYICSSETIDSCRLWESSSGKTQSSVACWFDRGQGPGSIFNNGFHLSINSAPIMCLAFDRGCGWCSQTSRSSESQPHQLWKVLRGQQPTLILTGAPRPLRRWLVRDSTVSGRPLTAGWISCFQFGSFAFDCCQKL